LVGPGRWLVAFADTDTVDLVVLEILPFSATAMNPFFLRVLLAADSTHEAAAVEHYLHDAGHEVVRVEARGDVALKAARLVHPDLVLLSGPLTGIDKMALAAELARHVLAPTPVLVVTNPDELPVLLAAAA
jgi:CheY-like chemotaxis protein